MRILQRYDGSHYWLLLEYFNTIYISKNMHSEMSIFVKCSWNSINVEKLVRIIMKTLMIFTLYSC